MGDPSDCFIRLLLKPLLVVVLQTSVVIFLGQAPVDIINHEAKYRNPTYSNPRYSHPPTCSNELSVYSNRRQIYFVKISVRLFQPTLL